MAISTALRETRITIGRSRALFLLSLCVITVSFFVLSLFIFITLNLYALIGYFRDKLEILAFLDENYSSQEIIQYVEKISGVFSVRYISPEQALEDLKIELGPDQARVLDVFEKSPIPPSLRVKVANRYKNARDLRDISKKISLIEGVTETVYGGEIIDRLWNFTRIFILFDILILIIIIFSIIFSVAQTIKMTILVRKDDIEIMQLVGASEQFIRLPFTFEGIIQGVVGGVISFILITGLIYLFRIWTPTLIFYPKLFLIGHIGLGGFFGFIGSITALNRFV